MIIYIDNSIAEHLENNALCEKQRDFFIQLALSHQYGRCILCGDIFSIEALSSCLPNVGGEIYKKIANHFIETRQIIDKVDCVLVLSFLNKSTLPDFLDGKSKIVKLDDAADFSLQGKCCLLSESTYDCDFYILLGQRYCHQQKMRGVDIALHQELGGGGATGTVLKKCICDDKTPTLCIADSDLRHGRSRKFPGKPSKGNTAKKLLKISKTLETQAVPFCVMCLPVHEVENLIPITTLDALLTSMPLLVNGIATLKRLRELDGGEPILYYDFKLGLPSDIKDAPSSAYWSELKTRSGLTTLPSLSSGQLMGNVINHLRENNCFLTVELDEYLVPIWNNIGKKVFTWGCVNQPLRA